MKEVRKKFPEYKILLTFFSPSGYEIKKNDPVADVVAYLPSDTIPHSRRFLDIVKPRLAVFVKYEFWPNYLFELQDRNIKTILVSGLFRKDQPFFSPYGGFMRKALGCFDHLFVQGEPSVELLKSIEVENVTVSGDTRFDRVSHQIEQSNHIPGIDALIGDRLCIVCGSTWPEDDKILLPYINRQDAGLLFILVPHVVETAKITRLKEQFTGQVVLYSEFEKQPDIKANVLIVDRIGLLSRLYSYADLAYVGGGMGKSGLHNILEPATFGVPVVIGKHYQKFPEAIRLESLAGLFSISEQDELAEVFDKLLHDKELRRETGLICEHFIAANTGATQKVMTYLRKLHANGLI
jgi:3-deoxy-D-manno-octulosonic-acid transferase